MPTEGQPPGHVPIVIEHRGAERRLDEHLAVAHLREQVAQNAGIPLRVGARRVLCEHFGRQPKAEHSGRRCAQEITSIHAASHDDFVRGRPHDS
jgi:hypothetical protein